MKHPLKPACGPEGPPAPEPPPRNKRLKIHLGPPHEYQDPPSSLTSDQPPNPPAGTGPNPARDLEHPSTERHSERAPKPPAGNGIQVAFQKSPLKKRAGYPTLLSLRRGGGLRRIRVSETPSSNPHATPKNLLKSASRRIHLAPPPSSLRQQRFRAAKKVPLKNRRRTWRDDDINPPIST